MTVSPILYIDASLQGQIARIGNLAELHLALDLSPARRLDGPSFICHPLHNCPAIGTGQRSKGLVAAIKGQVY